MKELYDLLKNPFHGLKQNEVADIQNRCFQIAKTLFENYCIVCGDKVYRFAEIEFYYYKKEESGNNNFDKDWNKETYPRNKDAGSFFFHYSGVDICFQCHYDDIKKIMSMENLEASLFEVFLMEKRFLQVHCFVLLRC